MHLCCPNDLAMLPYLSGYKTRFSLSRITTNNFISPVKLCYKTSFSLPQQSQELDPSYKTDVDFWIVFGSEKFPSYNRRNTVWAILD